LTKARAVRGVVEGSVGATLVEPIVLGQAALEQDENYNLLDSFLNVTIGGVLGGGLHVGFGKLSDTIERRSQKTKEQAVLTAIKQTLTDQEVNVTPIIKADLEKTFEKNLEKQNNLAQEKPTRIEDVTRTGKGLPGSLRATKPKTLVQFMKENGGIRPDDPQVSDLRASLDKATFTVLNKKDGLSLDEMTIRVQEAGYFLDKSDLDYGIDGATPRDLLDLIDRESRGEVLYSRDQETQFRDYERSQKNLEELDRLGVDPRNMTEEELRTTAKKLGVNVEKSMGKGKLIDEIFGQNCEQNLIQPTFITDYPVEMSPLAKKHRDKKGLAERFEAICNGKEICNAFSELNDPIDQKKRFQEQIELGKKGDDEAMVLDNDFIRALEYGMPPTAGLGIGIDRLAMIMTNSNSIQDVLFFPQMKPEKKSE